jgi:hypothetical protein
LMLRHANSPALRALNPCVVRTPLCGAAKAIGMLCHPKHRALDLSQNAKDWGQ